MSPPPPPHCPEEQSQCTVGNHMVWCRTGLRCSAASKTLNNCGYDHAPVTRGRMRTQFPLPHGLLKSPPFCQAGPPKGGGGVETSIYLVK